MDTLREDEIQLLIALHELANERKPATPDNLAAKRSYFHKGVLDWDSAFSTLSDKGMLRTRDGIRTLSGQGAVAAAHMRQSRPPMWYWYGDYYRATRDSEAYAVFCERVFGRNFAQHGFSDMAQVSSMLDVLCLGPASRVLDLGCGNGGIAEYISGATGAVVTGIDYIPEAIRQAQERARGNCRLSFCVMDMSALAFAPRSFDAVISIDTLYFVDLDPALRQIRTILTPGGQMAIFYASGADPQHPPETFDRDTLPPERTSLGEALPRHGLPFRTWDFTAADYEHARLKGRVIEELREALEEESNLFLYANRRGEASGVASACEAGAHARYLYHVVVP